MEDFELGLSPILWRKYYCTSFVQLLLYKGSQLLKRKFVIELEFYLYLKVTAYKLSNYQLLRISLRFQQCFRENVRICWLEHLDKLHCYIRPERFDL